MLNKQELTLVQINTVAKQHHMKSLIEGKRVEGMDLLKSWLEPPSKNNKKKDLAKKKKVSTEEEAEEEVIMQLQFGM